MPPKARRPSPLVSQVRDAWSVAIRAGRRSHRFIRIWAVVVAGRVFARSWSVSSGGWYEALVAERHGVLRVGRNVVPIRAVRARGEALKAAVDRAYLRKYPRAGEARYARDLCRPRSRATTLELRLEPPAN